MVGFEPTIPIYLQVMDEIKAQMSQASSSLASSFRLCGSCPQNIQVNPNTIARAYQGWSGRDRLYPQRPGTFVGKGKNSSDFEAGKVQAVISSFFKEMASLGVSPKGSLEPGQEFFSRGRKEQWSTH